MDLVGELIIIALLMMALPGPGLVVLCRLRWHPLELLAAGLGLSLVLVYLISFLGFVLDLRALSAFATTGLCVAGSLAGRAQLVRLWRHQATRRTLIGLGLFLGCLLLQLAVIRSYGGGDWWGDWYEHYERAVFFTTRPDALDARFLGGYQLPARPPLMNVVVAHVLMHTSMSFASFQVVHVALSALVLLPAALMLRRLNPRSRQAPWALLALLCLSPYISQQAVYSWTKLLCAFYVALGVALYLAGWQRRDPSRVIAAFVSLAAGALVHYSAGPYVLVLGAHYMIAVWPHRQNRCKELITIVLLSGALLSSWLAWSARTYGLEATVASNTAMTDSKKLTALGNMGKVGANLFASLVPFPLHADLRDDPSQTSRLAVARDAAFLCYQTNMVLAMGSTLWLVVALAGWRALGPRSSLATEERRFWWLFVAGSLVLGIAVHGSAAAYGVAHICLHVLILLGLVLVASSLEQLGRVWRSILVAGCAVDLGLGILLHLHLQHQPTASFGRLVVSNWIIKNDLGLVFLGDYLAPVAPVPEILVAAAGACWLVVVSRAVIVRCQA